MKKKLSLVLALSMMLTLVPMSAFAGSDNDVSTIAKVKDDANLVKIGTVPQLKIENDGGDWDVTERIELKIENADWLDDGDDKKVGTIANFETELAAAIQTETEANIGTVATSVYAVVDRKSDSRIVVDLISAAKGSTTALTTTKIAKDLVVRIPMFVEMDGEVGKVSIVSKSGNISENTQTFANARTGDTTVTIEDTTTFSSTKAIENIVIEENAIGAIDVTDFGNKYIKLTLDKDFKWILDTAKIGGDLITETSIANAAGNAELDDNELKIFVHGSKNAASTGHALKADGGVIGNIEITGLQVRPVKDAKEGDVTLTVSSDMSEIKTTKLDLGEYADYKMEIKADGDAKEVFSGRYEVSSFNGTKFDASLEKTHTVATGTVQLDQLTNDEDHELQTLIIEEKVEGSWTNDKTVVVEFPTWVKVLGLDVEGDESKAVYKEEIDENTYEFEMNPTHIDGKKKVELTFYVSTEAGKSGDITAKVSGRALDKEVEVVLGKAVAPVKVEAEVAKIKAGVRNQEIGKMTITEVKAEAIQEGDIVLELDKDMEWDDEPTVKVVKGNLDIDEDDVDVKDNILTIHVNDESSEPSVIEITNSEVKVDRSIAEGGIDVEIKGSALIQNGYDKELHKDLKDDAGKDISKNDLLEDYGMFNNDYYTKVEAANVITPADQNTQSAEAAKFVIGNAEFMVGEKVMTADVAPYIKDGRTMLSLSFVAQAMGVDDKNIMWDGTTRTVTIFKGDRIAQVQIGSAKMMVNGTPVMMDTAAEIKDGRTMLPVSYVAKALGANVTWDGATRTVTIK